LKAKNVKKPINPLLKKYIFKAEFKSLGKTVKEMKEN